MLAYCREYVEGRYVGADSGRVREENGKTRERRKGKDKKACCSSYVLLCYAVRLAIQAPNDFEIYVGLGLQISSWMPHFFSWALIASEQLPYICFLPKPSPRFIWPNPSCYPIFFSGNFYSPFGIIGADAILPRVSEVKKNPRSRILALTVKHERFTSS